MLKKISFIALFALLLSPMVVPAYADCAMGDGSKAECAMKKDHDACPMDQKAACKKCRNSKAKTNFVAGNKKKH